MTTDYAWTKKPRQTHTRRKRGKAKLPKATLQFYGNIIDVARIIYELVLIQTKFIVALAPAHKVAMTKKSLTDLRDSSLAKQEHFVDLVDTGSSNLDYVYRARERLEPLLLSEDRLPYRATLFAYNGFSTDLKHDLMVSNATANIMLECRERGYTFIPPGAILAGENFPPVKDDIKRRFVVPVDTMFGGNRVQFELIPDNVFGIDHHPDEEPWWFALECEYANTIETTQYKTNSVKRKMIAYQRLDPDALWGLPNLRIIFTAPSKAHLDSMKETARKLNPDTTQFLFATQERMKHPKSPKPDPTLLVRLGLV